MLPKKGVPKNFARFTGKHPVLFFRFSFIFKSILQVSSCKLCKIFKRMFFYRTPPDDFFCSRSFDILLIGMWSIWKVSLLDTVHPFLLKLFSIDLLIFLACFWSCTKWFLFDDFWYIQSLLLFAIMTVALLTNHTVLNNISL